MITDFLFELVAFVEDQTDLGQNQFLSKQSHLSLAIP